MSNPTRSHPQAPTNWDPTTSSLPPYKTIPLTLAAWAILFFVFSSPVAGFILLVTQAAVLVGGGKSVFSGVALLGAWAAGLIWVWMRMFRIFYLDTPQIFFTKGEKKPSDGFAYWILCGVIVAFFVSMPSLFLTLLPLAICDPVYEKNAIVLFFFVLALLPGVMAGLSLCLRALWVWRVRAQLENLPTSTVAAATVGPVELQGVVCKAADGKAPVLEWNSRMGFAVQSISPFVLEDETGRVRVEWPRDLRPGHDERLLLHRDSGVAGQYIHLILPVDRRVRVIGNLEVDRQITKDGIAEERHVVRYNAPPWARRVDGFTSLVGVTGLGRVFSELFGFGARAGLFLVTDYSRELRVAKLLRHRAQTLLLRGILWTLLAAIPLSLTISAATAREGTCFWLQ